MNSTSNIINNINHYKLMSGRRYSLVQEEYPDINKFPLFYKAKKIEVILDEGQYLFIPAGWFHFVFSEKIDDDPNNNLNIGLSHFIDNFGEIIHDCIICDFDENKKYDFNCPVLKEENITKDILKQYCKASQPFKVNNFKENNPWNCFKWTEEKLLEKHDGKEMTVNCSVSPFFGSNFVEEYFPKNWIETKMTFNDFLETKGSFNGFYYYLLQYGKEFKDGTNDVQLPSVLQNISEKEYAIWINFSNVRTALHFDELENILLQIRGRKRILLYPPSERKYLYTITPLSNQDICKIVHNQI